MNNMLELINYHYFFDIELSSICNLHCNICPRNKIVREQKFLKLQNIDLLNKWLPRKCNIMFSGMGEPLLSPHFFTAIEKLTGKERIIGVTTNGQLLNKTLANQIINSKLHFLQISVNKLDSEKYKQITNVNNDKLLIAIDKIIATKPIEMELQLSFISEQMSENEKREIVLFCNNRGIKYFIKQKHNRGGYINGKNINNQLRCCYLFSQFTFISCEGNVLSCCHDIEQNNVLGTIQTHSFEEIIENKIKIIRENKWFNQCSLCNDNGRNIIVKL